MRIAILTYPVPHKKTYDALCLLKTKGYEDVEVLASPMTYAKKARPAVAHRPDMGYLVPSTENVCRAFGYGYREISGYGEADGADVYLVCGAGIIPQGFVDAHRIVNAHPGYIPFARGLDALKWAVLEGAPVGATTHFLGGEVDAGEVIERRELELRAEESFFELGTRVYRTEVSMLVNALEKLDEPHEYVPAGSTVQHRRMPRELEREMLRRYEAALLDLEEQHAVQGS
ncbi:formyltransferase family protein [Eggerthella timonensis]|uniref:formyltransferase family protein n=1 Tax=Eggerthella timonensis TaxID=1871008 RepID=UPI000C77078F|nr:formyltransferase family protein [Eggerthella timonensis]